MTPKTSWMGLALVAAIIPLTFMVVELKSCVMRKPPVATGFVVDDVGFIWTTTHIRCSAVAFDEWCDGLPPAILALSTRVPAVRDRTCVKRERLNKAERQRYKQPDCVAWRDVMGDRCQYEKRAGKVVGIQEREVKGRDAGPSPTAAPSPACGTAACVDCEWDAVSSQRVMWVQAAANGVRWRCPLDESSWMSRRPGEAIHMVTRGNVVDGCDRVP